MKKQLEALLDLVLKYHASDVHFIKKEDHLSVTLRGSVGLIPLHSEALDGSLFNYLKYISHLDLGGGQLMQSGNFHYEYQTIDFQFRFSLLSSGHTQTAVLRILNNHQHLTIDNLSDDIKVKNSFEEWCTRKSGLILLSGPTGSGKTTTLHACMHHIATQYKQRVVTLEDPIELVDDNYLQLQINEKANFTYEEGIKELLRHDPDVVMIGEIRDANSAKSLIRMALSGHLVFSTIHAKNCVQVIHRLNEFGIPLDEIKETLVAISAQRIFVDQQKKGKLCIYEILEKQALQFFFQNKKLPENYQSIDEKIRAYLLSDRISYEEAKGYLLDG